MASLQHRATFTFTVALLCTAGGAACAQMTTVALQRTNADALAIMRWFDGNAAALWAIVGTICAGGIALLAVWLSNRHSRRQLAMLLVADKQQRERDRSMAVRRDVYIPAAEAIARIQNVITELADFRADHVVLSRQITSDLGSLAKVNVLGTDATVAAISRLTAACTLCYLQLTTMHENLLQRHRNMKAALTARDNAASQLRQIADLFHQSFKSDNNDATVLRRLQTQFEGDDRTAKERQAAVDRLLEAHTNEEREARLRVLEMNQEVLKHVPDALIAVRRELELPTNEDALRRMFAEQQTATLRISRRLLAHTDVLERAPAPVSPASPEERSGQILDEGEAMSLRPELPELH